MGGGGGKEGSMPPAVDGWARGLPTTTQSTHTTPTITHLVPDRALGHRRPTRNLPSAPAASSRSSSVASAAPTGHGLFVGDLHDAGVVVPVGLHGDVAPHAACLAFGFGLMVCGLSGRVWEWTSRLRRLDEEETNNGREPGCGDLTTSMRSSWTGRCGSNNQVSQSMHRNQSQASPLRSPKHHAGIADDSLIAHHRSGVLRSVLLPPWLCPQPTTHHAH